MKLPGMHSEIKPKRRREIYEDVASLSRPSGSYYVMIALSTVIAAYGLLINSAAVVVGAMLVAPLMGPIFGIALGLASGNRRLLWSSVQSEGAGIFIALLVGVVIGLAPFRTPIGAEWLVRTQPTLYDLTIALASGLAGAYAVVDDRVSASLPGVAISVAVLPPLAACGLAASAGNWEMAAGAIMLFTANFFAIQIAAAIVFSIFGMLRVERDPRARAEEEEGLALIQFFKRFWLSIAVLLVMAAFMTNTLVGLAVDRRLSATIEDTLRDTVGTISGARVSETTFERMQDGLEVTARILTPRPFETDQVASMEDRLEEQVDRQVHLIVRSIISRDMDRDGTVFAPAEEQQLAAGERERLQFLQQASQVISEHLQQVPGAELTDVQRSAPNGPPVVTALVRAPRAIEPEMAAEIEQALRRRLGTRLSFVVRTVLIRDANARQFLHREQAREEQTEREALVSKARTILDSWLADNVDGAVIDGVTVHSRDPHSITITVLTPQPLTDEQLAPMREQLETTVGAPVDLTVRYRLGGRLGPQRPARSSAQPEDAAQ